MEIKKDNKNGLMARRELHFILKSDKNPGFAGASKIIADEFKASEDQIMVENVISNFGSDDFLVKASIYDTKELRDESVKRLTKAKKTEGAAA